MSEKNKLKKNLSEILAEERTSLAENRTKLAHGRSILAVERTFAAWVRTGFSISGAGATIAGLLKNMKPLGAGGLIGSILIVTGVLTFIYAWIEFRNSYKYINKIFPPDQYSANSFKFNYTYVTIFTIVLLWVCLSGIILIWYNY